MNDARTSVVTITPELAGSWLSVKAQNRPLARRNVERLCKQMQSGAWMLNGEPIVFDSNGKLIDGQHRLQAVVESGVEIQSLVVWGIAPCAFPTMGTGKPRSAADVLGMKVPNATTVAAAARYIFHDERGDPGQLLPLLPTNADILSVVEHHPALVASASCVCSMKFVRRLLTPAIAAYLHYEFSAINVEDCDRYFYTLECGDGVGGSSHPVFMLRERLLENSLSKARLPRPELMALAIKAWNLMRSGETRRQLRWRRAGSASEPFPVIAGKKAVAA